MTNEITNSNDIIDSRDVIERIAGLEEMLCPAEESDGTDNDERAELAALVALRDDAESYAPDWEYGATLIRDSYFEDYAEELARDCGMIEDAATWPNNCINWEEAARLLKQDYTEVDFDGVSYWVR